MAAHSPEVVSTLGHLLVAPALWLYCCELLFIPSCVLNTFPALAPASAPSFPDEAAHRNLEAVYGPRHQYAPPRALNICVPQSAYVKILTPKVRKLEAEPS